MKRLIVVAALTLAGAGGAAAGGDAHPSISIQIDADFGACNCVTGGLGTQKNPYIIGPWSINNVAGDAVRIDGTKLTKSFVLSNMTIAGNGAPTSNGIALVNINPSGAQTIYAAVQGNSTSIQTADIGVSIANSSYVMLDGGGANPKGAGVGETGAGTINKHRTGAIDVENSDHITIRGWQMSASGPSFQPNWVTLDPSIAKNGRSAASASSGSPTLSSTITHSTTVRIIRSLSLTRAITPSPTIPPTTRLR